MARNQSGKESWTAGIIRHLTLAPEARTQEGKGKYPAGHFKKFFDIFRANMQTMLTGNLLTLVFALPLFALLIYVGVIGIEQFSYLLEQMDPPYVMTGLGFGLSAGGDLAAAKVTMLMAVRVLTLGIAVCLPILSFGIAGNMRLAVKLMWGEDFITKKDKYGKDVPRIFTEYFIGVKENWKQMLILFAVLGIIEAGVSNLIINFVAGLWGNTLSGGDWVGLIFACIIGFVALMMIVHMIPDVVMRQLSLIHKAKNAVLMDVVFFLPTLMILILTFAPFCLAFIGSFVALLVGIAAITLGFSYVTLALASYADYHSEELLTPLYEASVRPQSGKKKKRKNR